MQINRPCPVYLSDRNKTENGYFCSSCNKCVVDFRGKSREEINAVKTEGMCGIFTADQLSSRPVMRFPKRILFSILTAASFLGFNVQPLRAQQQVISPRETTSQSIKTDPNNERKVAPQTCSKEVQTQQAAVQAPKKRRKHKKKTAIMGRSITVGSF